MTPSLRVLTRFAASQNPLEETTRDQVKRYLYRLIGRLTDGFFRDDSWIPVHQIFSIFKKNGIPYTITSADYGHDREGRPNSKVWKFTVPFTGKNGRPQVLYGTITAAGAGEVSDPFSRYDLTVILG